MFQIIGVVLLFGLVFGSFLMSGGNLGVIIEAAPHELMAILGAGVASYLISNSMGVIKATGGGFGKIFKGPKWKAADYTDLLSLLFVLTKMMKTKGVIAVESHIEKPSDSTDLQQVSQGDEGPLRGGLHLRHAAHDDHEPGEPPPGRRLHGAPAGEAPPRSGLGPAGALQSLADALPALGIVAAVLGIIKTMGAITQPPEILGQMIGSALVGTFLGVFLAYGLVGPMATRLKAVVDEEAAFYAHHPLGAGSPPAWQRRPNLGGDRPRRRAQFGPAELRRA